MFTRIHIWGVAALGVGLLAGCGGTLDSSQQPPSVVMMAGPPEGAYCATPRPMSSGVTVTGTAQYVRREVFGGANYGGLGSADPSHPLHPASVHPIRFAEVQAVTAQGVTVQCGQTDAAGHFTLDLPADGSRYTIRVNSRAQNAQAYASILDQPTTNQYYSLETTVTAAASADIGVLQAAGNGDVLGGAFNILDQIVSANLYLLSQVGHCAEQFSLCANFDPSLHKISAYWKKGFNPNDYFGPGLSGLSFYLPGYDRLFILGGENGDTDNSDTDHFDNSIIIHEYGHFLEDTWLKTDSPGGTHDGDELLDPRLAWSEGWGDFIQAAVRGDNHYIDTIGNIDGFTDLAFYVDTETAMVGADYPQSDGEGNFREFAITRLLWDAVDPVNAHETLFGGVDDAANGFPQIWTVLTRSEFGYRDPNFAFRNVGLFLEAQQYLAQHPLNADASGSDWTNIAALNRQFSNMSHYGQTVVPMSSGECNHDPAVTPSSKFANGRPFHFSLTPAVVAGDSGSLLTSDLYRNNRFYHLRISPAQSGAHTLQLIYQDDDGSPGAADLDLYLYDKKARFGVATDIVAQSHNPLVGVHPEQVTQSETVSVGLSAGDYLINVNVFTGGGAGTTADFDLVMDGVPLCPANSLPH